MKVLKKCIPCYKIGGRLTLKSVSQSTRRNTLSISGSRLIRAPLILMCMESPWKCVNIKILTLKGCGGARGSTFFNT